MTIPTKTIILEKLGTTKLNTRPLRALNLATFDIEQNELPDGRRTIRTNIGAEVAWDIVDALTAIFPPTAEPEPVAHIIFTGPYEVAHNMTEAEERIEELLDAGFDRPTVVNARLDHNGEVLGLTGFKSMGVAKPGEIN